MDGIPVMSRAACRNHAVHTLGCVNQTAHEVTRGKGDHGVAQVYGQVKETLSSRLPAWEHARNRTTRLSHTDRLDPDSTSCNLATRLNR